jgi:hypothetical protein
MPSFLNAHAVGVGIADYEHVNPLPRTVLEDARAVSSLLTDPERCSYDPTRVALLLNEQATKSALVGALADAAARCDSDSTFVFYVSAHGGHVEDRGHRGAYLLPVDAVYQDDASLAETAISGAELADLFSAIPARRFAAIFDCCHSGGLGQPKSAVSPLRPGLPEGYFKELSVAQGRVIFAACRDSEYSWVRPGDTHSVFTKHLLAGLRGQAPGPGGVIRVFDLFNYVQPNVVAEQPDQHPVFKCEIEENFALALHTGGRGTPVLAASEAPRDGFKYDVFLSYAATGSDANWTRKVLLPRLKASGLRVCIDVETFRLGAKIITEIERAVETSRYTLAVLSPAYLESGFRELENVLAEHVGIEESQRRLLAVMRETCKPRLGMRARMWLDVSDDRELDASVERLVHELRMPPDN